MLVRLLGTQAIEVAWMANRNRQLKGRGTKISKATVKRTRKASPTKVERENTQGLVKGNSLVPFSSKIRDSTKKTQAIFEFVEGQGGWIFLV
jgi:hypothetical protein